MNFSRAIQIRGHFHFIHLIPLLAITFLQTSKYAMIAHIADFVVNYGISNTFVLEIP